MSKQGEKGDFLLALKITFLLRSNIIFRANKKLIEKVLNATKVKLSHSKIGLQKKV
ncbi:hypothetical protein EZS27_032442 [termite gut metagenome]|uniref:Uncharacterized protein n=1 Tax=termite gut metagenome TaxID=433724 RepID=A0A5J4Q6L1_9ZZZZ